MEPFANKVKLNFFVWVFIQTNGFGQDDADIVVFQGYGNVIFAWCDIQTQNFHVLCRIFLPFPYEVERLLSRSRIILLGSHPKCHISIIRCDKEPQRIWFDQSDIHRRKHLPIFSNRTLTKSTSDVRIFNDLLLLEVINIYELSKLCAHQQFVIA